LSRVNVRFFGVGNSDLRSEEEEEEEGVLLVPSSTSDNDNITEVDDEECGTTEGEEMMNADADAPPTISQQLTGNMEMQNRRIE